VGLHCDLGEGQSLRHQVGRILAQEVGFEQLSYESSVDFVPSMGIDEASATTTWATAKMLNEQSVIGDPQVCRASDDDVVAWT